MVPTPAGPVRVGTTTAEEMKVAGKTYRNDGEVVAVDPGWSAPGSAESGFLDSWGVVL